MFSLRAYLSQHPTLDKYYQLLQRWFPLFLISSLGLFLELAVIRWVGGEVRLLAYFKNLLLLAAFLGLAVGFALANRERDYRPKFAILFLVLVVVVAAFAKFLSSAGLAHPAGGDNYLWEPAIISQGWATVLFVLSVLIFFVLTMLPFIPLGQATGKEMLAHPPVPAYIVNIVASLAGTWAFALLSYLQTPPVVWFAVAFAGLAWYLSIRRLLARSSVVAFVAIALGLAFFGRGQVWSPYQRLALTDFYVARAGSAEPVRVGYRLDVQQVFYQFATDLSPRFVEQVPELRGIAFFYNLPYRLKPEGANVLVLGSGMGNDVAAALRNGARHVDAVEIDPSILSLGREKHPERPYSDPRVTAFTDDARAFLKRSSSRYDVIAFGLVDSHTLLSGFSSVRLESFVYTLESFRQVKEHLADDGVVSVTFAVYAPWIGERLGRMLGEVFGPDKVFANDEDEGWRTFVAGSVPADRVAAARLVPWKPDPQADDLPLSTDDWPNLYMRKQLVPAPYLLALLLVGLVALGMIARSFPEALRPNWHFWLLGAAFLLVEFKSVTELALLFGTTWFVNTLAISGVLGMALAANLVVLYRPHVNLRLAYALLFASLLLAYALPLQWLAGLAPLARALASMILLSLPLFFAGLIFSASLRQAGEAAGPLASNLSGSAAGGIIEYSSLWWGIKSLYIVGAAIYAAALVAFLLGRKR